VFLCYNNTEDEIDAFVNADYCADPTAKIKKSGAKRMWPFSQIERKLHERRAKYEAQTPEEKAAWRTANATVWIAVFTVVLALVGGITLYEVIQGGNDTRDLAEAAKRQAGAAVQQVSNFAALAIAAKQQSDNTKVQSDNTIKLANAATKQANVARNQLDAIQDAQSAQITFGFDFDKAKSGEGTDITVINRGPSIATYVSTLVEQDGKANRSPGRHIIAVPDWQELSTRQKVLLDDRCVEDSSWRGAPLAPQDPPRPVITIAKTGSPDVLAGDTTQVFQVVACYGDIFNRRHHADFCIWWNAKYREFALCQQPRRTPQ